MKTKTYKVYKFAECSKELQNKILENYRDINTDYEWYEPEIEYFNELLQKMGFIDTVISFNGFGFQGDGASFTCKSIELIKVCKHFKIKFSKRFEYLCRNDYIYAKIDRTDSHYSHSNTVRLEIFDQLIDLTQKDSAEINRIEAELQEKAKAEMKKIYYDLEKEYFAAQEDIAVIETLEVNDYDFNEDGKID